MIFKNGFVGELTFSSEVEIFTKIPLALFWMGILVRNAELLQTLHSKKDPRTEDRGFSCLFGVTVRKFAPSHTQIMSENLSFSVKSGLDLRT